MIRPNKPSLPNREGTHGSFIFIGDSGQHSRTIHCQTLLRHMDAEGLQLGTDDTMFREIGDKLVPEEEGIGPLGDARCGSIVLDDLPESPRRVGLIPCRCKEPCDVLISRGINQHSLS